MQGTGSSLPGYAWWQQGQDPTAGGFLRSVTGAGAPIPPTPGPTPLGGQNVAPGVTPGSTGGAQNGPANPFAPMILGGGGEPGQGIAPGVSFSEMTGPQAVATQSINTNPVTSLFSSLMSANPAGILSSLPGVFGFNTGPLGQMALSTLAGKGLGMAGISSPFGPTNTLMGLMNAFNNMTQGPNAIGSALSSDFSAPGVSYSAVSPTSPQGLGIQGLSPLSSMFGLSPTLDLMNTLQNLSPFARLALAQQFMGPTSGIPGGPAGGFGLTGQEGLTSLSPTGQINFGPQVAVTNRSDEGEASGEAAGEGPAGPGAAASGLGEAAEGGPASGPGPGGEGDGDGDGGD